MWSIVTIFLLVQRTWGENQCDPNSGPPGTAECVLLTGYNYQYQWATCLTNIYIKQKSGHRHACINPFATYCWYQCMMDVYSREFGPVEAYCSCTPSGKLTSSLPEFCYSPSGSSCHWYRYCIDRYYPSCKDTSNAYTIRYAEKFCNLYEGRKDLFSSEGQKWVDAARRCLQVNLVPLIRPWISATCPQVREWALAYQTPCYLGPDQNVSSICDLNCMDYFRIFWAIRGSFSKLDTAWESIKGLWNIETECGKSSSIGWCFQEVAHRMMNFTKITVQKFSQKEDHSSETYSVSLTEADAGSRFADGVGLSIVQTMKWNTFVMDWVAYISGSYSSTSSDEVDIIIVLGDSKALGIVTTSTPSINLNHTIHQFATAIKEGKLPLKVDGYKVWVKSLALCSDKSCTRTKSFAVSEKSPWSSAAWNSSVNVGLFGVIAILFTYQQFI